MSVKQADEYSLVRAITQRERHKIISELLKDKRNISELADLTKLDRATVSYHLSMLETAGIVNSSYEMLQRPGSKGRVGRFYALNKEKLREAVQAFYKLYKLPKPKME